MGVEVDWTWEDCGGSWEDRSLGGDGSVGRPGPPIAPVRLEVIDPEEFGRMSER